jgi:pilus assembly protein CpaF
MIPRTLHARHLATLLAPVAQLLDDPQVSEIMINGPSQVFAERGGRIEPSRHCFDDVEALSAALRAVAQYVGRPLSADDPILEAHLPDGSRIEAVIPPAAPDGPIVNIRRFGRKALSLDDLLTRGAVRPEGGEALRALVTERKNVLVSGGTGSGKSSLLGALAALVPHAARLVVIEDARELQLHHPHVVQLEAQPADAHGRGAVSVRALFTATLRLRPDRIVVGELRGPEALELIQAMTSGHCGSMSTIHAKSPADALARLETLALMADVGLPLPALRAQIASAIGAVVQLARGEDGVRRVTEICSVSASDRGYTFQPLYAHRTVSVPGTSSAGPKSRDVRPWP